MKHFDLNQIPFPEIPLDVPILSIFKTKEGKGPISYADATPDEISDAIVRILIEKVKKDLDRPQQEEEAMPIPA